MLKKSHYSKIKIMYRATVSATTVINENQIFGQVINRVGKISDFVNK